jgi:MFS family permease
MSEMESTEQSRSGFGNFFRMWLGQVVSLIGSGLTTFAIGVWVYQETGNVTLFTLIATFAALPAIFLSPIAGIFVDKYDRKWMLIVSDTGAALSSLGLLVLFMADALALWHIYLLVAVNAAFNTIQFPAFGASITLLVPKKQLGRAAGMMQFGMSGAQVLAPLVAGWLLVVTTIAGIIAIDLATFLFAVVLLLFVRIPRPAAPPQPAAADGEAPKRPSFWKQAMFGWDYIRERPSLFGLLAYFANLNLLIPMGLVLVTPLVLSFTTAEELGMVLAIGSAGMVVGSLVMTAWGGPKKRMLGILGFAPIASLGFILAGLQPSVPLIAAGLFIVFLCVPIINGCSQAIWQTKVEPQAQGRVFATRRMVAQVTGPIAFFIAGPLSEQLFIPLLEPGGGLAGSAVAELLGTGPGRGIGLLYVAMGVVFLAVTLLAWLFPKLRDIEEKLPDAIPPKPPAEARA